MHFCIWKGELGTLYHISLLVVLGTLIIYPDFGTIDHSHVLNILKDRTSPTVYE